MRLSKIGISVEMARLGAIRVSFSHHDMKMPLWRSLVDGPVKPHCSPHRLSAATQCEANWNCLPFPVDNVAQPNARETNHWEVLQFFIGKGIARLATWKRGNFLRFVCWLDELRTAQPFWRQGGNRKTARWMQSIGYISHRDMPHGKLDLRFISDSPISFYLTLLAL